VNIERVIEEGGATTKSLGLLLFLLILQQVPDNSSQHQDSQSWLHKKLKIILKKEKG